MKLVTLIVVLTISGGPHGTAANGGLGPELEVTQARTGLRATSEFGRLELQVEPGSYAVSAWTTSSVGARVRQCAPARSVTVSRQRHKGDVEIHVICSIK
jgi:hypothetical protein